MYVDEHCTSTYLTKHLFIKFEHRPFLENIHRKICFIFHHSLGKRLYIFVIIFSIIYFSNKTF